MKLKAALLVSTMLATSAGASTISATQTYVGDSSTPQYHTFDFASAIAAADANNQDLLFTSASIQMTGYSPYEEDSTIYRYDFDENGSYSCGWFSSCSYTRDVNVYDRGDYTVDTIYVTGTGTNLSDNTATAYTTTRVNIDNSGSIRTANEFREQRDYGSVGASMAFSQAALDDLNDDGFYEITMQLWGDPFSRADVTMSVEYVLTDRMSAVPLPASGLLLGGGLALAGGLAQLGRRRRRRTKG